LAPQDRIIIEAAALRIAQTIRPHNSPDVLLVEPELYVIAMSAAPPSWRDWKTVLLTDDELAGVPALAASIGSTLADLHSSTCNAAALDERFVNAEPFILLRVDPYYRTVARRSPEHAEAFESLIAQMVANRRCLTHGDFSPKNILVSPNLQTHWVIDFEVAHFGDPAFDLAFLLTHLILKSIHRCEAREVLDEAGRAFAAEYESQVRLVPPEWSYVALHVAALLLARVRGKSPVEYLREDERATVWKLGSSLLQSPVGGLDGLMERRDSMARP